MARPGVGAERVLEAIKELDSQGKEVTVTAVRERLGTGSFSTIGAVVSDWRQKRAKETRATVPEPSDSVRGLFGQLWTEAYNGAMKVHEPERQAFARDREDYERGKGEMLAEIVRLEAELDHEKEQAARTAAELAKERDHYRAELDQVRGSLAEVQGALGEARKRIEEEEHRNRALSAESAKVQAASAHLEAQVANLKTELHAEKDRASRTENALTAERDRLREELTTAQTRLGSAEGALSEARDQVKREEIRNRELSERVIAEAAQAQAQAARLAELEEDKKQSTHVPPGKAK